VLAGPGITARAPTDDEITGVLLDWRVAYAIEILGAEPSPGLRAASRELMTRMGPLGWVLCHEGRPVSFSTFNAAARGVVQVGGVFTPPFARGRGYARGVVAHSLLHARASGNHRSILFTGRTNVAAQRTYEALGYRVIGDFGLLLFAGE
jgi:predicted GNAT family acetyltransferase